MAETVKFGLILNSNVAESAKRAAEELAKIPGIAERAQRSMAKHRFESFFGKPGQAEKDAKAAEKTAQAIAKAQTMAIREDERRSERIRKTQEREARAADKATQAMGKAHAAALKEDARREKMLKREQGRKAEDGHGGLGGAFFGGVKGGLGLKDFGIMTAAHAAGELLVEGGKKLVEIVKMGFEKVFEKSGEQERRNISYRLVLGKEAGEEAQKDIERFAKLTEFSGGEVADQMRGLFAAGLRGQAARQAYALAGDLTARQGGGAANMQGNIDLIRKIQLKEGISEKMLVGLGFGKSDFYKQIAKQEGVSEKSAKERVAAGKVDPQRIMNALSDIVEKAQGGQLGTGTKAIGGTLQGRLHRLKELPGDYFEKLAESPSFKKFSDALGRAMEALDPESPTGRRIFRALEGAFETISEWVSKIFSEENITGFVNAISELPLYLKPVLEIASAVAAVFKTIYDIGYKIGEQIDKITHASDFLAKFATGATDMDAGPIRAVLKNSPSRSVTNNVTANVYPAQNDTNHTGQVVGQSIAKHTSDSMERMSQEAGMSY